MKSLVTGIAIIAGSIVLCVVVYVLVDTSRLTRVERVRSGISLKLKSGQNQIFLALPEGVYLCTITDSPQTGATSSIRTTTEERGGLTTTILQNGQTLVAGTNGLFIKFQIKDDEYSPVEVRTLGPLDDAPAYLNIRATF